MAPISEARKRANDKYIEKLDEIKVRVPKGRKAELQAHAEQQGESLNGFIVRAIDETIERDNGTGGKGD
ncbi:YlcI/YnfO family protein [Anaeromassilibacillus sp. SJQ-5]